jgi:hypothetical protein
LDIAATVNLDMDDVGVAAFWAFIDKFLFHALRFINRDDDLVAAERAIVNAFIADFGFMIH